MTLRANGPGEPRSSSATCLNCIRAVRLIGANENAADETGVLRRTGRHAGAGGFGVQKPPAPFRMAV